MNLALQTMHLTIEYLTPKGVIVRLQPITARGDIMMTSEVTQHVTRVAAPGDCRGSDEQYRINTFILVCRISKQKTETNVSLSGPLTYEILKSEDTKYQYQNVKNYK